jgi:hypothetical protein
LEIVKSALVGVHFNSFENNYPWDLSERIQQEETYGAGRSERMPWPVALAFRNGNNKNAKIHLERRTEVDGGFKGKTDDLHFHG